MFLFFPLSLQSPCPQKHEQDLICILIGWFTPIIFETKKYVFFFPLSLQSLCPQKHEQDLICILIGWFTPIIFEKKIHWFSSHCLSKVLVLKNMNMIWFVFWLVDSHQSYLKKRYIDFRPTVSPKSLSSKT